MNTLNIAVWTVGEHARRNMLPAINKSPCVNLVGIFTRNLKVLSSQSEKYGCRFYSAANDLLKDTDVDIIYIGSPNALHYDQVKQCLLNNKHVIVEKSALASLKETQEIVELAKSKGLMVMEAFMFLYHQQFFDLKKLIDSKKYGKMLFLEASFGFPHLGKEDIRYSKKLAGGALNDAGAYTVRAALDLLDKGIELTFSSLSIKDGYEVDTSGIAIFESGGVKANCKWVMGGSYKNSINIWCENGHIVVDRAFSKPEDYEAKIEVSHNGRVVENITSGKDNHFVNILQELTVLVQNNQLNEQYRLLLNQAAVVQKIRKKMETNRV